ncbi:SH3 domain-containing protein [Arthrobacter sp. MYb227]|uniref:SH3 domain-containing protein n=1 Tax=Arthrobacter sp. MYb227 TaxID=1848601 RepID=UPI0015E4097A|nr:SH3 domain-containing protein [Arthrobacter sp. MYb227]
MQRRPLGLVLALAVSLIGGTASIATAAPIAPVNTQHVNVGLAPAKISKKTTANLNLRKSATTQSASLLVIPKNTTLTIIKVSGKWSQVSFKSKTGWVSNDYLTNAVAKPAAGKTYNYTKSFVPLKASASAGSKTILDLQRRTKVEVTGKSDSWVKIVASGKAGFVPASALDKSNPAATYRWINGKQKVHASNQTTSKVLTTLSNNTRVEWLRTSGAWQQVRSSAGIGWVPSKNLATKEIKPAPKVYNFAKSYVDVKTTAAASSKTVLSIHRQSKVEVLGKSGAWVKIAVSGKTGFVPASTLQTSNPAPVYRWSNGNQKVYKSTSTNSQSIITVKHNTKIQWLRTSGAWQQVRSSAGIGWVPSKNLATKEIKPAPKVYNFAKSYVDVKTTAAASSKTVLSIHRQSKVEVLGKSGAWVKIAVAGKTGFVPVSTLQTSSPATINRWIKGNQRVFASTSTSAKAIATFPQNTKIEWLRTSGAWQQVKTSAGNGWIQSTNLSNTLIKPKVYNYTTAFVDVKSTASASAATLVSAHRRTSVEVLGTSGAWTKIVVSGKTGYVPSSSLSKSNPALVYRWIKGNQRVFASTSTSAKAIATLQQNTRIEWLRTSGAWQQVKTSAGIGWIQSTNLSNAVIKPAVPQKPKFETARWTTANLNLRQAGTPSAASLGVVPIGEKVMMATTVNGWAQVETSRGTGWMSTAYLSSAPVEVEDPETEYKPAGTQYRWTTGNLNLRSGNSTSFGIVGVVPMGEKITYFESKAGWARVKSSVGQGWVSEDYLSKSAVGQMQPDTLAVIDAVKARYGAYISSFGGVRAGSTGHSSGKATDMMIKDYKNPTSIRKGDEIAAFLIRNQRELGISYLIWQDKIWLGNSLGWQEYSTSGKYGNQFAGSWNDTTKHLDHIHAETLGDQATGGPLR